MAIISILSLTKRIISGPFKLPCFLFLMYAHTYKARGGAEESAKEDAEEGANVELYTVGCAHMWDQPADGSLCMGKGVPIVSDDVCKGGILQLASTVKPYNDTVKIFPDRSELQCKSLKTNEPTKKYRCLNGVWKPTFNCPHQMEREGNVSTQPLPSMLNTDNHDVCGMYEGFLQTYMDGDVQKVSCMRPFRFDGVPLKEGSYCTAKDHTYTCGQEWQGSWTCHQHGDDNGTQ